MMTCRRAVELLIDYVAEELPSEQRAQLEAHFQHCPPCLIYLESYQVTIRLTRQLPHDAPLPPEMESRLVSMLKVVEAEAKKAQASAGDQLPPL